MTCEHKTNKGAGFIAFIVGMIVGRYGLPLIERVTYVTIIVILLVSHWPLVIVR